jgi:outer membrane protein insertion porin family
VAYCLLISLVLPGLVPEGYGQTFEGEIVRSIKVKGNRRVEASNILYYVKTEVGKPLSSNTVSKDIEQIFSLGQFSDIQVETLLVSGGVEVIYVVEEIPSIGSVQFIGNDAFETSDLMDEISLKRGATYRDHLVPEAIEKIKAKYHEKAFFLVDVEINTQSTPQGLVDVTIRIKEGEKIKIEVIRFLGNKSLDSDDLADQMETEEKGLFTFFDESGIYKKDILKLDVLRLESYYQDHGFPRVRVQEPEIEINRKNKEIYITIRIEEGNRYRVGKIETAGDDLFSPETLLGKMKTRSGQIYNASQLRQDVLNLAELYSQRGHAYADVNPKTKIDDKRRMVDLKIEVDKGRKVYVGKVNILGNIRTRDNVIRREFRLKEGELFDSKKLKRTKQRINNLGFFEDVKIDTHRGELPDQIDIDTLVTERPTGSISFGAGFSSVENLIFTASIAQNNFMGTGRSLNLTTSLSSIRTNFDFSLTDPRILDSDLSFRVDAFNRRSNFFSFDSKSTGGGFQFGKSLSETDWAGVSYGFKNTRISNILPQDETPLLQNGDQTTSRISPTFIRDTRDDFINPTKGWRHVIRFEFAGSILGGSDFYKAGYEVSFYHPLFNLFGKKLVGVFHSVINYGQGYGGEILPVFEHYFLGGANSLRGFNIDEVGPRSQTGQVQGGDHSLLFNIELQYPLNKQFRFFSFYDRGNVYGSGANISTTSETLNFSKMRESVGFGVRFFSPFGPVSLAYGYKLDPVPGDSNGEFHFSAGKAF